MKPETSTPSPLAHIHTQIVDETFVATTPHVPDLRGESAREHEAINQLMARIRQYRASYESQGKAVPWIEDVSKARVSKDVHVRQLSGLWPAETTEPRPTPGTRPGLNDVSPKRNRKPKPKVSPTSGGGTPLEKE